MTGRYATCASTSSARNGAYLVSFRFCMVSVQILAGRNRGEAMPTSSAVPRFIESAVARKDISRAGAQGTSDEAKDLWLGCSIR